MPHNDYWLRVQRQLSLRDWSLEKQLKLKEAKIFVGGVGGVGGTSALYLLCAGVENLTLCHYGTLERPDLNRQILMEESAIGKERVSVAKKRLKKFYKESKINIFSERIDESNILSMLDGRNLAISARPNFQERMAIAKGCAIKNIPMIDGSMFDMFGYVYTMIPKKTACYQCLIDYIPNDWDELGFPVLGAFSGFVGTIVAMEAIKLIIDGTDCFNGELLIIDGFNYDISRIKIAKKNKCKLCELAYG